MTATPAFMGFGVINPAMLGACGLAVAPIIIHLLSRRRYRQVEWGAMRFLLEAEKQNRRRIRLEQWLLLALRCVAMLLLALVVARPFVRPGFLASLLGGRGAVHRVVVLDDSASLLFRDGPEPQFVRLRAAAGRLLSWLSQEAPQDPVSIYLASAPDAPLARGVRMIGEEAERIRGVLSETTGSVLPAHPRRLMERVAEDIRSADSGAAADVYVFSDFQRSEWTPDEGSVFRALRGGEGAVGSGLRGKSLAARLVFVGVSEARRENVAVTAIRLDRPRTVVGVPATVRATVVNHTSRRLSDVQLSVSVHGAPLPVDPVDAIDAGQGKEISFEAVWSDAGYSDVEIGLAAADRFPLDDVRRGSVIVADGVNVLLVNGQPSADSFQDEVYLLQTALSPQGPFASGLRVDVTDSAGLSGSDLSVYECVFLCNVGDIVEPQADALRQYVRAGGGLLIFPGDEIQDFETFNRVMGTGPDGLLPLPVLRTASIPPPGVGMVRLGEHPLTSMFPDGGESLTEYVHFRTFIEVDESPTRTTTGPAKDEASPAVVLARYADSARSPAIVERTVGSGRVVLFTSTCDLAWNDWARSPDGSYVITMLEAVQSVARRSSQPIEFLAGTRLTAVVSPEKHELSAVFKSPHYPADPAFEAKFADAGGIPTQAVVLDGPVARVAGSWQVSVPRRGGGLETRVISVNGDPIESDLTSASRAELSAAAEGLPHEYVSAADDFLRDARHGRRELWPVLLVLLVMTLLGEQFLAWVFGGGLARAGESRAVLLARRAMRRGAP